MDIFSSTYIDTIKRGLQWFLDSGELEKNDMGFEMTSRSTRYLVKITVEEVKLD
jgi:hypothetical protein